MGTSEPAAEPTPTPRASTHRKARTRPSSRPSRLMVGAGAVAAISVIAAGLVRFPTVADDPAAAAAGAAASGKDGAKAKARSERPVKYVRLKPGQKAPKGAKVIREAAPTPRIVVRRAAPARQPASRKVVTQTRQSG